MQARVEVWKEKQKDNDKRMIQFKKNSMNYSEPGSFSETHTVGENELSEVAFWLYLLG